MDTSSLTEQSISLHEEIEAIGQRQLELNNQLRSLAERKEQVKKAIKKNLKQQEITWNATEYTQHLRIA